MIFFLIQFFQQLFGVTPPAVFLYSSTRMMLSAVVALSITIFCGPFFIRKLYEMKIGQKIRGKEECPLLAELHKKKKDTPTMGGILILFSILVSLLLFMDLQSIFTWILFITTIVLGGLGFVDDWLKLKYKNSKGLSAKKKLLIQGMFTLILGIYFFYPPFSEWLYEIFKIKAPHAKDPFSLLSLPMQEYMGMIFLPFLKYPLFFLPPILSIIFLFFVVTGSSNAVNLTDGLDGLASGCLIMVASAFGIIAFLTNHIEIARYLKIYYIEGSAEIGVYLFALSGATLGFLWYNGYPAQIFMGDTGSLSLGGIIGVCAVLLKKELLLAIIGGIFVLEALSVILQVASFKLRNKKRIFLCAPLHHHFEYKGWPETKVVLRFWILSLFFAIIGLASLKFQ